jgi:hypothetical protein
MIRPKPGGRFVSRHTLKPDARPPYGPDDYAVQVVTATRRWGPGLDDFTIYYPPAERWDQGNRNSNWYLDATKADRTVREWLTEPEGNDQDADTAV